MFAEMFLAKWWQTNLCYMNIGNRWHANISYNELKPGCIIKRRANKFCFFYVFLVLPGNTGMAPSSHSCPFQNPSMLIA